VNNSEPQSYVSAFIPPSLRERLEEAAREHDRSLERRASRRSPSVFADPSGVLPSPSGFRPEGSEKSQL
jgi:hypothetical protein